MLGAISDKLNLLMNDFYSLLRDSFIFEKEIANHKMYY